MHIGYSVHPRLPCLLAHASPRLLAYRQCFFGVPPHPSPYAHFEALCLFQPDLCPMDTPNPFVVRLVLLLVEPSVNSSPSASSLLSLACIIVCTSLVPIYSLTNKLPQHMCPCEIWIDLDGLLIALTYKGTPAPWPLHHLKLEGHWPRETGLRSFCTFGVVCFDRLWYIVALLPELWTTIALNRPHLRRNIMKPVTVRCSRILARVYCRRSWSHSPLFPIVDEYDLIRRPSTPARLQLVSMRKRSPARKSAYSHLEYTSKTTSCDTSSSRCIPNANTRCFGLG